MGNVIRKRILSFPDLLFVRGLAKAMQDPKRRFDEREFVRKGEGYLFHYVEKNVSPVDESRRKFLKALVFGISAAAVVGAIPGLRYLPSPSVGSSGFPKLILVSSSGTPIKASSIPVNEPIITVFEYPLQNEPNFLVNLGDQDGKPFPVPAGKVLVLATGSTYDFPGGVGPYKSIVAYSAICQHLGCQPPEIHFYPPEYMKVGMPAPADITATAILAAKRAGVPGVIHCDCHGSTYDPYHGAAVLTGPTERPLPAVVLEWDQSTDYLYAVGEVGVPVYGHTNDLSGGNPVTGDSTEAVQSVNPFPS